MYHLRGETISFTMRKWHIYECPFAKAVGLFFQGGMGRGHFQTLHRKPLLLHKLHYFVKCFILLKHFEDA